MLANHGSFLCADLKKKREKKERGKYIGRKGNKGKYMTEGGKYIQVGKTNFMFGN